MGKQETREKILKAALSLFGEKAYDATSTREIAERAGVNHLTLFRHFGSKEVIFRESVVNHVSNGDFLDEVKTLLTGKVRQDIETICRSYLNENIGKGKLFWIWFTESRQHSEMANLLAEISRHLIDFLSDYLVEISETKEESIIHHYRIMGTMLFGQLTQYILWNAHPIKEGLYLGTMDSFIEECVELFTARIEPLISKSGIVQMEGDIPNETN